MANSPAFQMYPDQFMGGKPGLMEPLETHVYLWLLFLDWNQTGFFEDERQLAKWCRIPVSQFRKAWPVVRECFEERDGRLFNPRLDREREKQKKWREKSAEGGRKSAARRKGGSTTLQPPDQPPHQPKGNIPVSYSPVPDKETTTSAVAGATRGRKADWLLPLCAVWEKHKGAGTFPWGKAGRACKPLIAAGHSGDKIAANLDRYLTRTEARFHSLPRFAEHFADFDAVKLTGPAIVDGWLSDEVDRLTRPPGLVA